MESQKDSSLFRNKCMQNTAIFLVFVVGLLLIGVVGILCPYFLVSRKQQNLLPNLLFSVYCLFVFLFFIDFILEFLGF
jgi:protein-S-isoprenylcysteine O-methyltransferase Ste14